MAGGLKFVDSNMDLLDNNAQDETYWFHSILRYFSGPPASPPMVFVVFANGTGKDKITILPEGQKMNNTFFMDWVLGPFADTC
jgi:hypothetical protein